MHQHGTEKSNIRIDAYLSEKTDYTRSKIQKLIKDEQITVNDKKIKPTDIVTYFKKKGFTNPKNVI